MVITFFHQWTLGARFNQHLPSPSNKTSNPQNWSPHSRPMTPTYVHLIHEVEGEHADKCGEGGEPQLSYPLRHQQRNAEGVDVQQNRNALGVRERKLQWIHWIKKNGFKGREVWEKNTKNENRDEWWSPSQFGSELIVLCKKKGWQQRHSAHVEKI